jgi:hypothetical protein
LVLKEELLQYKFIVEKNNGRKIELMEEEKIIVVTDQLLPFQISIVSLLL